MDGMLDTDTEMWRGSAGTAPLGLDVAGNIVCPICARRVFSERLSAVHGTALFGCERGHRFELQAIAA